MENKQWYKHSKFRNLVDMHIADREGSLEKFDAEAYAENMAKAGVDCAYVYASNCLGLCLFPSKNGYRHRITNKRDIFGETVKALKARGITVVGYLNSWSTECYNLHPDWRILNQNGKGSRDVKGHMGRYGQCCPNSLYREYFYSIVDELCSTYDLDGYWTDMVGFWAPVCYCAACKDKYEKNGKKLPDTVNWYDPVFMDYTKFKNDTMTEYAQGIYDTAHRANPKLSIGANCAGWPVGSYCGYQEDFYNAMDYCAGDFFGDPVHIMVHSRVFNNLTPNRPFEYMTSRCYDLYYHTMTRPIVNLMANAYGSLLSCGSFLFIDAIDPAGTMNPLLYERIKPVNEALMKYAPHIDYDAKLIADAAVYFNFDSLVNVADNGKKVIQVSDEAQGFGPSVPLFNTLYNITEAFLQRQISFDIVTRTNIKNISEYKVIILPDLTFLSKDEVAAFKTYVENGGALYVSGKTSLCETGGVLHGDFMLGDVLGVKYEGAHDFSPTYVAPLKDSDPLFGDYTRAYPHMIKEGQCDVTSAGGEMVAEVVLPACSNDDNVNYVTAISDPPMNYTGKPSVVWNTYGKGKTVYSAGMLENSRIVEVGDLFCNLVKKLAGDLDIVIDAPGCVQQSVVRTTDGRILCMLLNTQKLTPPIPVEDVVIRIKTQNASNVLKLPDKTAVNWAHENGYLIIKADKLELFDMYEITF